VSIELVDRIGIVLFLSFVLVAALIMLIDESVEDQCRSRRTGERCVHGKDHPGSHRDRYDDYWN
jgi:hypothetical protein